ncbi:four helix bundle protein [Anaerolineales bacterium HSG25]|nr:four helix bundle protein [Anaerolineales bacterium HSG25]
MFTFESLDVWKRSLEFANVMFDIADGLPRQYQRSLGEQLRRTALSVPTNIAEGKGRDTQKQKAYFYNIAKGSIYEVVSLLAMIGKRGCLARKVYSIHYREADEIAAMITALARKG